MFASLCLVVAGASTNGPSSTTQSTSSEPAADTRLPENVDSAAPSPTPPDCIKDAKYSEEKGFCVPLKKDAPAPKPAPRATAASSVSDDSGRGDSEGFNFSDFGEPGESD